MALYEFIFRREVTERTRVRVGASNDDEAREMARTALRRAQWSRAEHGESMTSMRNLTEEDRLMGGKS